MNFGTLLKWGAILLVAWLVWQWVSNNVLSQGQAQPQAIPYGQWAYPTYYPGWGAGPWRNPLNIGRNGSNRGRRKSGPRPYGS